MAAFTKLEDSPMFRKQMYSLEQQTDELKERCVKLHKECNKFMSIIEEGYKGDNAFSDALEAFGAGQDDPISVAIGGPVMSKFTMTFKELGTYKELLRSQVEHILSERMVEFINVDVHNVKECRRRLDKAILGYDQAREKFVSVRKGTRPEVITALEEDLQNAKSTFERSRFNLVSALATIETKKKYEFLESISAVMDAHLRYFKQGHELLSQMEPFIHQVLTYAQQSKEMANMEQDKLAKRIQEFRTQEELANLRLASNMDTSSSGDGIHVVGLHSYKSIEALMHSTANGEVQVIKQGYLLKRSTNFRGEWRRRFFVLDSHGKLHYYGNKPPQGSAPQQPANSAEGTGYFGRFRFLHQRTPSQSEESLQSHSIDLRTSTIKIDADEGDMRFCFRIITPAKTYTLQAENAPDQVDWIEKVTGVIASLLNSPSPKQMLTSGNSTERQNNDTNGADSMPHGNSDDLKDHRNILQLLRCVPGNDICADCSALDPDWASLNLGILVCIECSGVHRNLGVHKSKVRSLRLDVKVWEPIVMNLFHALGNTYSNSVWEELLSNNDEGYNGSTKGILFMDKPKPHDALWVKEKYIQSKYVEKLFVLKEPHQPAISFIEAIRENDLKKAYQLLVSSVVTPNTRYEEISNELSHEPPATEKYLDPAICERANGSSSPDGCLQGCSLLHIACQFGQLTIAELLLLSGADINSQDIHGRTPLHLCVSSKNDSFTKYLLKRGAKTTIKDGGGLTALERRMELGAITDEELFILFVR